MQKFRYDNCFRNYFQIGVNTLESVYCHVWLTFFKTSRKYCSLYRYAYIFVIFIETMKKKVIRKYSMYILLISSIFKTFKKMYILHIYIVYNNIHWYLDNNTFYFIISTISRYNTCLRLDVYNVLITVIS